MSLNLAERSNERLAANAAIVELAASRGIRPDPKQLVSEWAAQHRVVPDDGARPGPWDNSVSPELVEPMDVLSPDDPTHRMVLIKCAQSGGSAIGENWIGYIMHRAPGPMMYIGPTVKGAKDWYQEKLGPTIMATSCLSPLRGGVVAPNRSRSGEGSTSERIRFKGGFLNLAGANSAATLRQHSIRYMLRDDRSAWTEDADGEGNPMNLSDQRLKTYRRFGMAKVADISTPKIKGMDIDADYENSDRRRYYMACKACGDLTDWDWDDVVRSEAPPYHCKVSCPSCGEVHTMADRDDMKSPDNGARWVPTVEDPETGEVPQKTLTPDEAEAWRERRTGKAVKGYWLTGFMNTFDTWENIAAEEDAAGDDPALIQPFYNGTLGRSYEPKGEGPDWEKMSARREADWRRGELPAGPLFVTFTVDVQAAGLYWLFKGWGPNKQGWTCDHGFISGLTDAPLEGAWPVLDMVVDRGLRFGNVMVAPDLIGVDSNYNADAALTWVKRRHNAMALNGEAGWAKPPIFRMTNPEIKKTGRSMGKARKYGVRVWHVGTYGLKGALMVYLDRGPNEGGAGFPSGYQHFPADAEDEYFQHLANEYVAIEKVRGLDQRTWKPRGPNHYLDCEVYGWALTHHAGIWHWNDAQWDKRAADLAELSKAAQADLFQSTATAVPSAAPVQPDDEETVPKAVPIKQKRQADAGLDALAKLNQR